MFGFGWVRTLGRCLFWRIYKFSFDFGWIAGKGGGISKFGQNSGVLRRGVVIPRSSVGPRRGVA